MLYSTLPDLKMNYIDIVLFLFLLFAAINGFRKGLILEIASLAALILGVWGAIEFSYITTSFLIDNIGLESENLNLISFFITFIIIVILVHIVGTSLSKFIEVAMLGWLNRIAGMAFGVLKTAFILSILLIVFNRIDTDVHILPEDVKSQSQLYEPIRNLAPTVFPFIKGWEKNDKEQRRNNNYACLFFTLNSPHYSFNS